MRILRHADYRQMKWKNGLGNTEEVIAHPPGSDIATFGWRLSIAHVGADGPFSIFAGIDRTIALLDGDGLLLDLADRTIELDPKGAPFAFSGDLDITSRNKAGPTIDLNIMTRRGHFRHEMQRLRSPGPIEFDARCAQTRILVFNSPAFATLEGTDVRMGRFDALVADPGDRIALAGNGDVDILRIDIISE